MRLSPEKFDVMRMRLGRRRKVLFSLQGFWVTQADHLVVGLKTIEMAALADK
jgi:hypothetical protein